jgi:hypothetical protein
MATKQMTQRTCDLCGSQVHHAGLVPIGWTVVEIQVGDVREDSGSMPVETRDICPFCRETLEGVLADSIARRNAAGRAVPK